MKLSLIGAACILFFASVVQGQLPTGTILGTVKDTSGALVVGAKVTARNTDTDQSRTAVTGNDGSYRLDALPVGNYEITVDKAGFKTEVQTGLTLDVAAQVVVNVTLQVGQTAETVSVSAQAAQISTTTSSLGGLVDSQSMVDLPLNGRNYSSLTLLQPGVTQATSQPANLGENGDVFSSNGAPVRSNNTLLDGTIMNDFIGASAASATGSTLGVDGIREFRVITNSFDAEYGGTMGSQVVMVSQGGSNRFHGDAFEFLRNNSLDARNFFDLPPAQLGGKRLPAFHRNQYGGAFGGPIKKDKTFFFGNIEQLTAATGLTESGPVLGAGCHGVAGAVITQAACPQLTVPSATINPVMAPLVALYPLPNTGATTYGYTYQEPTSETFGQMRVDQTFSSKDTLFARYTVDTASLTEPYNLPAVQLVFENMNQFLTVEESHIFSPSLLNTAHTSFSRANMAEQNPTKLIGPQYSFVTGEPIGQMAPSGIEAAGTATNLPRVELQNIFAWTDDLIYMRGLHTLKFGATVNHYQDYTDSEGLNKGSVTFPSIANFLTGNISTGAYAELEPGGNVRRYYHFNVFGFYAQDDWHIRSRLTLNLGFRYEPYTTYTSPNGISAALRNLATDTSTTIGPPFENPSLKNFGPRVGFAWDVFGDGKTSLRSGFGLLYDDTPYGSALYFGAGVTPPYGIDNNYNNLQMTIPWVNPATVTSATIAIHGLEYYVQQPHMLQYNLTAERQLTPTWALTVAYAGSRGIHLLQYRDPNPYVPNGIPSGGACVAPPAGTVINGFTTSQVDNGKATSCWLTSPKPVRINTAWNGMSVIQSMGDSHYNALEVVVDKKFSRGLQLQSAYTWARAFDDTQGEQGGEGAGSTSTQISDPYHERTDRGPTDFDIADVWNLNAIYHLPTLGSTTGFRDKLVNGWWMSGIWSQETGYPLTAYLGSNRSQDGIYSGSSLAWERPDLNPGRNNANITHGTSTGCGTGATRANGGTAIAGGTPLGTPGLWFDPCAFTVQPSGFLGNEGRGILRGPGFDSLTFSMVKDTDMHALGEQGKVEFRGEFFNLLNHANFLPPGSNAPSQGSEAFAGTAAGQNPLASAGQIVATNGTSRQIQFGLKIIF